MESKNISIIGKEMDIIHDQLDSSAKVGTIKFDKKDLKSETDFITALQKVMEKSDGGTYTVHHSEGLFARFDIKKKQITRIHRLSENTGMVMPCWDYFSG